METAFVILAQPALHCCENSFHNIHSFDVWNNLLGYRFCKVLIKSNDTLKIYTTTCNSTKSSSISTTCRTKKQDLFNAMGSMYAAILFIGVQNATSVQPVVSIERTVFYRERAAGMYSALPYAFGQVPSLFGQFV